MVWHERLMYKLGESPVPHSIEHRRSYLRGWTFRICVDGKLLTETFQSTRAADVMQQKMDLLSPWLEKWRISITTEKLYVTGNAAETPATHDSDDEPIAWKQHAKYLGVIFYSKLNLGARDKKKTEHAKIINVYIGPLIIVDQLCLRPSRPQFSLQLQFSLQCICFHSLVGHL
ncbi:hypothetical protein J6590_076197 [Homalodisca vitripennis]|nr:hypothetical protein J6590_076197 [Homalodisca vitripennis]